MNNFFPQETLSAFEGIDYQAFINENADILDCLLITLEKQQRKMNRKIKICLEGGHIYTDEQVQHVHLSQLEAFGHVHHFLLEHEFPQVQKMLFIDNYHPKKEAKEEIFDIDLYQDVAKNFVDPFDIITWESDFETKAKEYISQLRQKAGMILISDQEEIMLNARGKPLLQKANGDPTCAMLDSALTMDKLNMNDFAINILPQNVRNYSEQQKKLRRIVSTLRNVAFSDVQLFSLIL